MRKYGYYEPVPTRNDYSLGRNRRGRKGRGERFAAGCRPVGHEVANVTKEMVENGSGAQAFPDGRKQLGVTGPAGGQPGDLPAIPPLRPARGRDRLGGHTFSSFFASLMTDTGSWANRADLRGPRRSFAVLSSWPKAEAAEFLRGSENRCAHVWRADNARVAARSGLPPPEEPTNRRRRFSGSG